MSELDHQRFTKTRPKILFLSWFGIGFSPWAPGTLGSLAAIPVLVGFNYTHFPLWLHLAGICSFTMLACWLAQDIQQELRLKDPGWIVIDEVLGMWACYLFFPAQTVLEFSLLFLVFRFFDIVKIPPARQLDRWNHGIGTIMDDIVSSIYTGLVLIFIKNNFLS